jgi:two-component system OmpR family sensor kinase
VEPGTSSSPDLSFRRRLVRPKSWPVRWRLALVSSGLTLAILLLFGGLIGKIATERIRDDFNSEVSSAVKILAGQIQVVYPPFGEPEAREGPQLNAFVLPDDASARVYDIEGDFITSNTDAANLGPVQQGLNDHQGMLVATEVILNDNRAVTGYVQYGRSLDHVDATIDRVWALILAGILGGTLLAVFAGVAIARRAMRPIASLTETAQEIATDASHELRTPLTSVLANLELLQGSLDGADQAEDREIVDSALRSSKRMGRLVGDLLLLARADAGRLDAHHRVDLAGIAGDAAAEVAPLMGDRRLVVENDHPLRVEGSRDELHRMVLNLLDNAIRHTPPSACVELSLREDGDHAVVEVGDDGPGIPAEMRSHIFDRFVRGSGPADTARGTGTGLGLSIVSAVAQSHGGSVEAAESSTGGALFVARIPLADRAEKTISKPLKAL